VSGLSSTDTFVLMEAGKRAIEQDEYVIDPSFYMKGDKLSADILSESGDILDQRSLQRHGASECGLDSAAVARGRGV
jgi:hypothetical protein